MDANGSFNLSPPSLIVGAVLTFAVGCATLFVQRLFEIAKIRPQRLEQERFEGVKQLRELVNELKECHWRAKVDTSEELWIECCTALNDVRLAWNFLRPVLDDETVAAVGPLIELARAIHADGELKKQAADLSANGRADDLILTSRTRLNDVYGELCGVIRPKSRFPSATDN